VDRGEIVAVLSVPRKISVLGIETSCDDTAVAVVIDGEVRSSVIVTQQQLHAEFGGVVPELASRAHSQAMTRALRRVLYEANIDPLRDLDGVAVTSGPGLAGSLMVGVAAAKACSLGYGLPLIGVDHMEGHVFGSALEEGLELPALVLLVSGGHSELVMVDEPGHYRFLGGTVDDAAGEAFDKVARMLGLGFPGGPEIEAAAQGGSPDTVAFPRASVASDLDFSFSGVKTAVLRYLQSAPDAKVADVAASFQVAVVDALMIRVKRALDLESVASFAIGGGVAANSLLRERTVELGRDLNLRVNVPSRRYCTDNGAMIAAAGAYHLERGDRSALDLGIDPSAELMVKPA
jgi:N6-L-threonylcarbamoyladenine synthase